MDEDIKLYVRLKYQIADMHNFHSLRDSYPTEVIESLFGRWCEFDETGMTSDKQWELFIGWLVEELCKYEETKEIA